MKLKFLVLIPIIAVLVIFAQERTSRQKEEKFTENISQAWPHIASRDVFFEKNNFAQAIETARSVRPKNNIAAVVVPQHLLASSLMASQIQAASGRNIATVVIIGPNHYNTGESTIATAKAQWETEFGLVASDAVMVDRLLLDLNLVDSPEVFRNEHAVGAIVPFIKYYLPEAKIVPIVFSSYANLGDADKVAQWLKDNLSPDSLIVYSIDFSHYLTREQADPMDISTKQYIESRDVSKIITLGNDNLDSPASLATALLYAQKKGLPQEIVANKNSDDFNLVRQEATTSYILVNFYNP